jgi:hypothetical protein
MSEDVTIRAARAQQLLEDEVLQEAVATLIDDAWYGAIATPLSDTQKCVAAVASIQAISDFESRLRQFVTDGKVAERKPYKVA